MCTSKAKVTMGVDMLPPASASVSRINGRQVLQPSTYNCNTNLVPRLDRRNSLQKLSPLLPPPPPFVPPTSTSTNYATKSPNSLLTPPMSPTSRSPRPQAIKRAGTNDPIVINTLSCDSNKQSPPRISVSKIKTTSTSLEKIKKSKSFNGTSGAGISNPSNESLLTYSSSLILDSPGSIAASRREHMALQQAQRKMKIAHYGRSKSAKFESINKVFPIDHLHTNSSTHDHVLDFETSVSPKEEKRCSFITPNSDPIYVAYHDEEWGVPVHDDNMLFELLVLSGAQVGSDWTSILKKRQVYRDAFSGFDAEVIATLTDKQMMSIATEYSIEISRIRGVVDNSIRILEVRKEFGSFAKYMWGFVNQKPICPQYKFGHKIPVKTSKSESISKDMVRRGFRFVGPTVLHSFMQAAGLTNDHLITCHRHHQCSTTA